MLVELEWLQALVARHCPTFYLHPDDRYLPCSAEFFIRNSDLRQAPPGGPASVLLPRGAVAGPLLLEAQAAAPPGSRLWLHLDPAARVGEPLARLADVPVYAHPKAVVGADGQAEAVEITYVTIYAYNGPYRVGGAPFLTTGAHDGDIEHITMRAHPTSGELQAVWYNCHRPRDGCWVAGPEVPRAADGSIAAYTAYHGHGVYPWAGRTLRHFLMGNDLTSRDGPAWRPRRVVLLPPLHPESGAGEAGESPVSLDTTAAGGGEAAPAGGSGSLESALASLGLEEEPGAAAPEEQPPEQQPPEQQQQQQQQQGQQSAAADGGSGSVETPPAPRPRSRQRRLAQVPSRGSQLSSLGCGGSGCGLAEGSLPAVVVDDPCEWLWFTGNWGSDGPPGPAFQSWYNRAECPVSRSGLLRVVGHFVSEPDRC